MIEQTRPATNEENPLEYNEFGFPKGLADCAEREMNSLTMPKPADIDQGPDGSPPVERNEYGFPVTGRR